MKKYHVATGDGKGYYGVGYESYRQAESLLKISQAHDPQAHIVEEEYPFTNADCIRAISDRELADFLSGKGIDVHGAGHTLSAIKQNLFCAFMKWLRMPADEVPDERR